MLLLLRTQMPYKGQCSGNRHTEVLWQSGRGSLQSPNIILECANGRGRFGDRLPEGTQKPLLGTGSPSLQCRQ